MAVNANDKGYIQISGNRALLRLKGPRLEGETWKDCSKRKSAEPVTVATAIAISPAGIAVFPAGSEAAVAADCLFAPIVRK